MCLFYDMFKMTISVLLIIVLKLFCETHVHTHTETHLFKVKVFFFILITFFNVFLRFVKFSTEITDGELHFTEINDGKLHIEYNDEEIHATYDLFYEIFQRFQYQQDINTHITFYDAFYSLINFTTLTENSQNADPTELSISSAFGNCTYIYEKTTYRICHILYFDFNAFFSRIF